MRKLSCTLLLALTAGCSLLLATPLDRYGTSHPAHRAQLSTDSADTYRHYQENIKPLLENRCVVCHGCYDAPCQLKLESAAGLERGASKDKVYDGTRLLAANLTRLHIDAQSAAEWRDKGFFPVLNERAQTPEANQAASVMLQMLSLKKKFTLPADGPLPDNFDFGIDRQQSCPSAEEFDRYATRFPQGGMPYGMPAISESEHQMLSTWITAGAPMRENLHHPFATEVQQWEAFFNGADFKTQLMARYIYEHLYLANLYFDEGDSRQFFKLVRASTPPGTPVQRIASRRPFDAPGVTRVYYRLIPNPDSIVAKSHMPYRLDAQKRARWQAWFKDADYAVTALPDYDPVTSANPFKAFEALPVKARYRFMLEEAQFTIMGFIKGPVCRGQTALNVINDQFWVFFVDPDYPDVADFAGFLAANSDKLNLPAERDSTTGALGWLTYAKHQRAYLKARNQMLKQAMAQYQGPSLEMIWQGDGDNPNAALTVMRHFDSATVVQGLVGETPKTAWVITYPLLERIHYLLVAGFDVYGNVGHQLLTRTYMDFLRMEGEQNFLNLLPSDAAKAELAHWYRGAHADAYTYFKTLELDNHWQTQVQFDTNAPKQELYKKLQRHLDGVRNLDHNLQGNLRLAPATQGALLKLQRQRGNHLQWLPDTSLLLIEQPAPYGPVLVTLALNKSHSNITSLLLEHHNRLPAEDSLSVAEGVLTYYPNAFFHLQSDAIPAFNRALKDLASERDYRSLKDTYGVRRNAPHFWAFSDRVHHLYRQRDRIDYGLLDYNRMENR